MKIPPIGTKVLVTALAKRTSINLSCLNKEQDSQLFSLAYLQQLSINPSKLFVCWHKKPTKTFTATITGGRKCNDGIITFPTEGNAIWTPTSGEFYPVVRKAPTSKEVLIAGYKELTS